ncbi:ciliogenesis and planar polarity effector 2 [Dendrobates tinctorius]|uniref:ciliogenesis and planar polarity effector 2 n=1 Tax=Dendrobates tinctorius TaxID=92724 RepID=UPI003CC96F5D
MSRISVHIPGSVITAHWLQSPEGRDYQTCVLRKGKRRTYGLIERPVLPPQFPADVASYKIFVSGKSGVGKTSLVAKLCGLEVTPMHHETTGIQTSCVYWPVRPTDCDHPIIFAFHFWDCGESALKKFDHILPACKENADAVLFLFSFTDRSSFEDVPALISRTLSPEEKAARLVIGTKLDQFMHTDVTEQDIRDFQQTWQLPVMRVRSIRGPRAGDGWAELADAAPVLDGLAEVLWCRDQVTAGLVDIRDRSIAAGGREGGHGGCD